MLVEAKEDRISSNIRNSQVQGVASFLAPDVPEICLKVNPMFPIVCWDY